MDTQDAQNVWGKFREIGPVSIFRFPTSDLDGAFIMFIRKNCSIRRVRIENLKDLDQLESLFMVRYAPNSEGKEGLSIPGSDNFIVRDYVDAISTGRRKIMPDEQHNLNLIRRNGVNEDIEISVVMDTILGKSVLVDGTKRTTSMLLLRKEGALQWPKNYKIEMLILESNVGRALFPFDFAKF